MTIQNLPSVPFGWLNTIGQIGATNHLCFHHGQNGLAVALDLLTTHTAGAPVLDDEGEYLGFINVFDVLRALDAGMNLSNVRAKDIMRKDILTMTDATPIAKAAELMEEHHVVSLPVERNGKVAYSVKCHDLLRAKIALWRGGSRSLIPYAYQ
jgi:CBS domain-containing protein